jgi:hypothetical protein
MKQPEDTKTRDMWDEVPARDCGGKEAVAAPAPAPVPQTQPKEK